MSRQHRHDGGADDEVDATATGSTSILPAGAGAADSAAPAAVDARRQSASVTTGSESAPTDEDADGGDVGEPDRTVRDSAVVSVTGQHVALTDSAVVAATAGSMEARDTLIVVGTVGHLSGDARVLIDARSALLFGAALGVVLATVRRVLR